MVFIPFRIIGRQTFSKFFCFAMIKHNQRGISISETQPIQLGPFGDLKAGQATFPVAGRLSASKYLLVFCFGQFRPFNLSWGNIQCSDF